MTHFEYKGYLGSAEVDTEGMALVGKLLGIRDVIAYSAENVAQLEAAFHEAVEDYLAACAAVGDEPDTPFKGSFNVRVGQQLHRDLALMARSERITLNDLVCRALVVACSAKPENHTHFHQVKDYSEPSRRVSTSSDQPTEWQTIRATTATH